MATPILLGSGAAQEQPQSRGFSPTRGWQTIRTWKGEQNAIIDVANALVFFGYEVQIDHGPGRVSTVRGQIGVNEELGGEEPVNLWEIQPITYTKDILESDLALVDALTDNEVQGIRSAIQNPDPANIPALTGDAQTIYDLMKLGVRDVKKFTVTLRHTQTVSNNWAVPLSLTNVNQIISTDTLISQEGPPGWIADSMPSVVSTRAGLSYGWFKSFPTITVVSYNRTQLVQEWEYGLWSTFIYGVPL